MPCEVDRKTADALRVVIVSEVLTVGEAAAQIHPPCFKPYRRRFGRRPGAALRFGPQRESLARAIRESAN